GVVGPLELGQRWLGQVHVAVFDQRAHVAEQQGQQQGGDVLAVDVGVGHEHDLVVPDFFDVEFFTDAGAEGGDHCLDFGVAHGPVEAGAFNVENFPAQRQDSLSQRVAALFGGATGRVTFHNVNFGLFGVLGGTVGELAGHTEGFQRRFSSRIFASLTCGHAGLGGEESFANNVAGRAGVAFQPVAELFVHCRVDVAAGFRVTQFGFGLAFELWFGQFHGDDGGEAFTN